MLTHAPHHQWAGDAILRLRNSEPSDDLGMQDAAVSGCTAPKTGPDHVACDHLCCRSMELVRGHTIGEEIVVTIRGPLSLIIH